MSVEFENFYEDTLSGPISDTDTVIPINNPPASATEGWLIIDWDIPAKREFIYYTSKDSTSVILTSALLGRGLDGTTAIAHTQNAKVRMNVSAGLLRDVTQASAVMVNDWNSAGWVGLGTAPTVVQNNGNRSIDLSFAGVDYTDRLSKGMRLRIPRTGTAVQTQVTSLNGTNQYWNDTTVSGMTFTDDFCAGAWVKLSSYIGANVAVMGRFNGTNGWSLLILTDGTVLLTGYNGGITNVRRIQSYQSIPLNKWVHISAQLDMSAHTATSTTSYIMIDGVDVPAFTFQSGTNPTSLIQAGNFEVGGRNGGTDPFPGKIAQAFVSSAKITQANIRSFMNAPLTSALCTTHNIVSAYAFDGNGNDINTTNANNLTGNGGAVATNADAPFKSIAYGIIMNDPVFSASNTTLNVSTPEGYPIPSQTLGTSSYSSVKVPYGFPAQRDKWSVGTYLIANLIKTGAVGSIIYNINGCVLKVPTGAWNLKYSATLIVIGTSSIISGDATLSNASNTYSETFSYGATAYSSANVTYMEDQVEGSADINPTTLSDYYLNVRGRTGTISELQLNNPTRVGVSSIIADNALL